MAVVVSEYSFAASHYSAVKSLSRWLEEPGSQMVGHLPTLEKAVHRGSAGVFASFLRHKVPGISGVDTRAITKRLRQEGSILAVHVQEADYAGKCLAILLRFSTWRRCRWE